MSLTVEELARYVAYIPETGELYYLHSGRTASSLTSKGYIRLKVLCEEVLAHRAAWALAYGSWPVLFIDHINEDKTDNRLTNLRQVTHSENLLNQSKPTRRNKYGVRGVAKSGGKFKAHCSLGGKNCYLGTFDTVDLAAKALAAFKADNGLTSEIGADNGK